MKTTSIQKIINNSIFDKKLFDKEVAIAIANLLRIFNKIDIKKLQHYKDIIVSISLKHCQGILLIHTSYRKISSFPYIRNYTLYAKSPPAPNVFLIKIENLNIPKTIKYIIQNHSIHFETHSGIIDADIFIADAKKSGYKIIMNLWFHSSFYSTPLSFKLYLNDKKEIKKYKVLLDENLESFEKSMLLRIFNNIFVEAILKKIDYINKKNLKERNCEFLL
jgi:hypothetical protein